MIMSFGSRLKSHVKCKKLTVIVVELICYSLAIFATLQEIPLSEIHETNRRKNEG